MKIEELSKSKLLASLLFCSYVIFSLIDKKFFMRLLYASVGLVLIWLGEKMIPIRLRAGTHLFNWKLVGWCFLLYPLIDEILELIF